MSPNSNLPLEIRRPNAVRPWQHVLEPLNGYLVLAEKLFEDCSLAGAFNFGPQSHEAASVQTVIEMSNRSYGSGSVLWGDGTEGPHEAGLLSLDISKAQDKLDVSPRWDLLKTIEHTMGWYQKQRSGVSAHVLCDSDIAAFSSDHEV